MIGNAPVFVHHFDDVNGASEPYWRDIGTLDSYYDANIDLCRVEPKFNLYDPSWQTYTLMYPEPPAKTVFADPPGKGKRAEVVDSLLCQSSIVSGARVKRSILSNRVRVDAGTTVDGSILLAGVQVGDSCRIQRTIVDKWVKIPPGTEIGYDPEADARRFTVTPSGIVVVPFGHDFSQVSFARASEGRFGDLRRGHRGSRRTKRPVRGGSWRATDDRRDSALVRHQCSVSTAPPGTPIRPPRRGLYSGLRSARPGPAARR